MQYQVDNSPRAHISPAVHAGRSWPVWPLKVALAALFLGPLLAPLFQATYLPLVADSGALARNLLSLYVCPTPEKSYMLLGFPMAVCARCWGATIGLWMAWFWLQRTLGGEQPGLRGYFALPWLARLIASSLPFWLWVAEIRWWPAAPYWILLLNGAFAGFAAGMFFYSIWPGLRTPQRQVQRGALN